jgi:LAGLIDADG endonuclease
MDSENPSGADNQQETASLCLVLDPSWLVGFVDGEGCFSVSFHRNRVMHRNGGWQLQPTSQVYQDRDHRRNLEAIAESFGCGRIRTKGPESSVLNHSVDGLRELEMAIVPFFEEHPAIVKASDFGSFAVIMRACETRNI